MNRQEPNEDERQINDQWVAGGTVPDADETWNVPKDDPDATWPMESRR